MKCVIFIIEQLAQHTSPALTDVSQNVSIITHMTNCDPSILSTLLAVFADRNSDDPPNTGMEEEAGETAATLLP